MEQLINRYKKTEEGIIPNDWIVISISASCKLINGRGFKPYEWRKKGLPIIRIQNLNGSDEYNYYEGTYDKKIEVTNGQILYAWSGSRGTSFGPHIWHNRLGLLNYHTWKVVVNEEKINSKFFFHALKKLTKFIEEKAHGASALVHVQKWEMEKFKFPTPISLTEQKSIADALSDVDDLIANLEKLIAKKKAIKQGAMQQLLTPPHKGGKRLEGFSGEWKEVKLRDIGNSYAGGTPSTFNPNYWNGNIIWLPSGRVQNNHILKIENEKTITQLGLDESAAKLIKKNSVLIAITGATCGNIGLLEFEASANQSVVAIEPNEMYDYRFIFYTLLMNRSTILKFQTGSAQGGVNLNTIKKIELYFPEIIEQRAISSILSEMHHEISILLKKLEKLKLLKQGMMQELLTGKTRLI